MTDFCIGWFSFFLAVHRLHIDLPSGHKYVTVCNRIIHTIDKYSSRLCYLQNANYVHFTVELPNHLSFDNLASLVSIKYLICFCKQTCRYAFNWKWSTLWHFLLLALRSCRCCFQKLLREISKKEQHVALQIHPLVLMFPSWVLVAIE